MMVAVRTHGYHHTEATRPDALVAVQQSINRYGTVTSCDRLYEVPAAEPKSWNTRFPAATGANVAEPLTEPPPAASVKGPAGTLTVEPPVPVIVALVVNTLFAIAVPTFFSV